MPLYNPINSFVQDLRKLFKRRVQDSQQALLGDGTGRCETDRKGFYYYRFELGGVVGQVRSGNASFPVFDGAPIDVAYNRRGELEIVGTNWQVLDQTGVDSRVLNQMHPQSKWVYLWQMTIGLCTAVATRTTNSLLVSVKKHLTYVNNVFAYFETGEAADKFDFSAYNPAEDQHRYGVVWQDTYGNIGEVTASDAQSLFNPLSIEDVNEAVANRPPDAIPYKAFVLANNGGTLRQSITEIDLRQFLNTPQIHGFPNPVTYRERIQPGRQQLVAGSFVVTGSLEVLGSLIGIPTGDCCDSGSSSGGMTSFDIAADSGIPATIEDGETVTVTGTGGAVTSISGNTVTIDTSALAETADLGALAFLSSVGAAQIDANAVGSSELADDAVDTNAIQNLAVTAAKIANDTITATQIAANAIGSSELADNAVDTGAIADEAVTVAKIADGTADKFLGWDSGGEAVEKSITDADVPNTLTLTQINDTGGNEEIKFTATGSAVNEFTVTNAATGNNPKLSATGGDTNIGIELLPKGTGAVISGATVRSDTDVTDDLGTSAVKWLNTFTQRGVFEETSAPSTPSSADIAVYGRTTGSTGAMYSKDDGGNERQMTPMTCWISDAKSSGTAGGTSSSTTWNNRDVNTEDDPFGLVTISSNKFVLVSGEYDVDATAPALGGTAAGNTHRLRLWNVTSGARELLGENDFAGINAGCLATLTGRFTSNGTDEYRFDHYTVTGRTTNGLGNAASIASTDETYLKAKFIKRS